MNCELYAVSLDASCDGAGVQGKETEENERERQKINCNHLLMDFCLCEKRE